MSALGLVAYDGSGSSSEEDDEPMEETNLSSVPSNQQHKTVKNSGTLIGERTSTTVGSLSKSSMILSKFIDDEEDDIVQNSNNKLPGEGDGEYEELTNSDEGANPMWSKLLPQPKKVAIDEAEDEDIEIGPIPPKKTYGDEEIPQPPKPSSIPSLSASKFKGKVRISIPFLNSLDENEPEEDSEKKKVLQPSQKGSGLFALLPQPKNAFGRGPSKDDSNQFLRNKITSKVSPSVVHTAGSSSSCQNPQPSTSMNRLVPDSVKNKLKRPAPSKLDEIKAKLSKRGVASATVSRFTNDSDSEDEDSGDFFSLTSTETVDEEALEKLKLPMQDFSKKPEPIVEEMEVEDAQKYENPMAASSSRSDDLMKYIQPKRGKQQDVQIIDIKADDLRPDNTEWLRNLTDESQTPARRSKGLGGMVKRKHQITYLAFEAKAREQELKNQWAQNRANKMATNNKYGF